ncbi:MAG TPA: hypothetical protein VKK31_17375 [Thermoanaerobaculia bacterium]|nr:hypothetical protein [Thermoanaerobaculia bacterium]
MISFQQGNPPVYLGLESSMSYHPQSVARREEDDPAITASWLWAERHRSLLSYAYDIQRQIDALRERLAALEKEQERLLSDHGQLEDNITLPLTVLRTFPARIVERVDSPFYLFGAEAEE